MYSRFDISSPEIVYSSSHVAMTCNFTISGTPIDVSSPTFNLYAGTTTGDPNVTTSLTILRPIQKDPSETTGKYLVTFLTDSIAAGNYLAVMTGVSNSETLVSSATLTFHTISRIQWLIETLLTSLKGKYNLLVPDNLMVVDPRTRTWSDGECYSFLARAIDDINSVPPFISTAYSFDLGDWPQELSNFIIMGAQIYALFAAASLDTQNYFDVQIPIKVNLYRGDKFLQLMQFLKDDYWKRVSAWKEQYWFNYDSDELGIVMSRVPIRITRPVSDELYFHKLYY